MRQRIDDMMIFMVEQYHEIENSLRSVNSLYGVSDCQGVICGVLVFGDPSPILQWIDELFEGLNTTQVIDTNLKHELMRLSAYTQQRLEDPGMSFELLLPEDDQIPLEQRVEALSGWCEGFLYGLTLAGLCEETPVSRDGSEFINDVLAISRVVVDSRPDETDEVAYFELVEYLRVGVLLLAAEFQSLRPHTDL